MDSLLEKEVLADGEDYADELEVNDESKPKVKLEKKKEVERHHGWKKKPINTRPVGGGKRKMGVN